MKPCRITHFLLTMLLAFPLPALANAPANASQKASPLFEDPVIEARLSNLAKELRCVVCQNETLAEHHAPTGETFVELQQLSRPASSQKFLKTGM